MDTEGNPLPVPYVPAAQPPQVPTRLAPRMGLYVPAPQSVQLDTEGNPLPVPYVPATHWAQVPARLAPRDAL